MKNYRKSHDLSLSPWGPYSKRYVGISHIPSLSEGKRFDLSVFPSLYRRGITPPNVMWESGYHPWDCSADLRRYTHRHELLWKDEIYTDITFSLQSESQVRYSCRTVNNTNVRQALVFHHMTSLYFPPLETYSPVPVKAVAPPTGEGLYFVAGLDYEELNFREDSPLRTLSPDGTLWGETGDHGFTGGRGLGDGFGEAPSDRACYAIPEGWDGQGPVFLRCRNRSGKPSVLILEGGLAGRISLSQDMEWVVLTSDFTRSGESTFTLSAGGKGAVDVDGIVFCPAGFQGTPFFSPASLNPRPEVKSGPRENSLILQYEDLPLTYGLSWDIPGVVRHWACDEPDNIMRHNVHEHNHREFQGPGEGHFTEVFTRPVFLDGSSDLVNQGMVCCGTEEQVREMLGKEDSSPVSWTGFTPEERPFTQDNPYTFSLNRLAATALLNVVYPVRIQGEWSRHHTPGRWWDCLYTWDSGFIGLGFTALDLKRAEETLNAYLTEPGNPHAAFIHHGSPVPTQFFLYQEIFNRSQSKEFLGKYYDSLLQYHRFMAGRLGSSSTATLKSGLLKTWDYFYNSGGWDDYCPQVHVRKNGLEATVAPAITTSVAVRTALILKGAALLLGKDTEELDRDIAHLSGALQQHSWDGESGYFSYVVHDEEGKARHMLTHGENTNFDMGFDGAYPLNAGICTKEQEERLLERLFSPDHLWTDTGLTAIDQSAPYFKDDGYWNGAVWMSHQWIFWKTMLDMGRSEEAWKIAFTALELWKRETEDTYLCFEHFVTSTGRGAGWHHFGGLSSPVMNWYSAYFVPGTLSAGHDSWITEQHVSRDSTRIDFTLVTAGYTDKTRTVLAVLAPEVRSVKVSLRDGTLLESKLREGGAVEITLSPGQKGFCAISVEGKI